MENIIVAWENVIAINIRRNYDSLPRIISATLFCTLWQFTSKTGNVDRLPECFL